MRVPRLVLLLLLIALFAALAIAWPSLAATVRRPRIDDWCPEIDAGVVLRVRSDGREETIGQGGQHWLTDCVAAAGDKVLRIENLHYRETDGVPGSAGEKPPTDGAFALAEEPPTRQQAISGSGGGYRLGHLEARFTYATGGTVTLTIAPPPTLQLRGDETWHELALVPAANLALHWRQTASSVQLRVQPLDPVQPMHALASGVLIAGETRGELTASQGGLLAELPLAALGTEWLDSDLNVRIDIDLGVASKLTVTLRRP